MRCSPQFRRQATAVSLFCLGLFLGASGARAADKVTIAMVWTGDPEAGGIYQAQATGLYKKNGLDVTVMKGGPQVNGAQLLVAGAVDFHVSGNGFSDLNYASSGAPGIAIMATMQKDPQVLLAHPDSGIENFADIKGHPVLMSKASSTTWWRLLEVKFGFTDQQIRPFTGSYAPFIVDDAAVTQDYITDEPFYVMQAGATFTPKIFSLADNAGYVSYARILETTTAMVEKHPDVVQRFVDATIEGEYSYLYGDPTPGNVLIKKDDPELTDAMIAFSIDAIKENGIMDSGDSLKLGIGAMSDERWKALFDSAVAAGIYPASMDYKKAYTLRFVNKGVGLSMRK